MEVKEEVKTYQIKMICNRCKQGEMVPTGMAFTSLPSQFEHRCNCCGYKETYKTIYPAIRYELKKKKGE